MLQRDALRDIDPNMVVPRPKDLLLPSKPPFSSDELIRIARERDTLTEEVRRLTRELSMIKEPDHGNTWQKITSSTREMRRMEEEARVLKAELEAAKVSNAQLLDSIKSVEEDRSNLQACLTAIKAELAAIKSISDNLLASLEVSKKAEAVARSEFIAMQSLLEKTEGDLKQKVQSLTEENRALNDTIVALRSTDLKITDNSKSNICELDGDACERICELQNKLLRSEQMRKKLLNQVHELRGNVRVFARCRPFLRGDEEFGNSISSDTKVVNCCEDTSVISISSSKGSDLMTKTAGVVGNHTYSFDQVFKENSSQEAVFEAVSDLIQSALDGYRVCIFAYGQTGSGKTHTMTGSDSDMSSGIIPRAVNKMVEEVIAMKSNGWQISLRVSMLEVYNETIRDILSSSSEDAMLIDPNCGGNKMSAKYRITFANGKVSVSDVGSFEIDTSSVETGKKCLNDILQESQKNRFTAATSMNERSSRSHVLFYLDISGYHPALNTIMEGGLRLVDLAGSERLDRAGTSGDASRFRETISINKSLSSLGEVFLALGNKSAHVPYRNSKLTMLLQDCLSGDGKALMFVNIPPTAASVQETLCSLRFASQVNQVELGQAKKSIFKNPFLILASLPQANKAPKKNTDPVCVESSGKRVEIPEPLPVPTHEVLISDVSSRHDSATVSLSCSSVDCAAAFRAPTNRASILVGAKRTFSNITVDELHHVDRRAAGSKHQSLQSSTTVFQTTGSNTVSSDVNIMAKRKRPAPKTASWR